MGDIRCSDYRRWPAFNTPAIVAPKNLYPSAQRLSSVTKGDVRCSDSRLWPALYTPAGVAHNCAPSTGQMG